MYKIINVFEQRSTCCTCKTSGLRWTLLGELVGDVYPQPVATDSNPSKISIGEGRHMGVNTLCRDFNIGIGHFLSFLPDVNITI